MREWKGEGRLADPYICIFGTAGLMGLKVTGVKEERQKEEVLHHTLLDTT